ncbi:chorismate-binding protein [Ichthyenterobacterium sp. W332]|uniref:Chorismate-binding protein n=1 Tax=Microcosmobacter mediterraneus TaxID=3075607 RepID=A0ABU2YGH1_9FLAO|nr:chorismate-binding protein [Ichthyenterobacterium sp. W332]MDT0557270.1 chorismate-binding protein [Ichthyenterobacterium sp. W332]
MDNFFDQITQHFLDKRPLVVYSKPDSKIVKALLQNDKSINYTRDYNESGFVFAPFDSKEQSVLIPLHLSEQVVSEISMKTKVESPNSVLKYSSNKNQHIELVDKGISAINNFELKKVVLSRVETIEGHFNAITIFKTLLQAYPSAFVYCFYHPKIGLWLGATPETLMQVEGNILNTMALAGTQTYKGTRDVFWDTKDIEEQKFVTKYIINALKSNTKSLNVSEVKTVRAGTLLHLQTDIEAIVNKRSVDLKSVIETLHPTPAICGLPREEARDFIFKHEAYEREFYTGFLGELNITTSTSRNANKRNVENNAYRAVRKTSELFVNLRCMQLKQNNKALIYVGGGITKDSRPEHEWQETVKKLETMASVITNL